MSKYFVLAALLILSGKACLSQDVKSANLFTSGNIKIKHAIVEKAIIGFYDYIKSENIKGTNALAFISLQDYHDTTTYLSIELVPMGIGYGSCDSSTFYGYLMKDSFYCFFYKGYKYLERNESIPNPGILKCPNIKLPKTSKKVKIPKPIYDPYKWEIVFQNNSLLEMFPKGTVERFVTLPKSK